MLEMIQKRMLTCFHISGYIILNIIPIRRKIILITSMRGGRSGWEISQICQTRELVPKSGVIPSSLSLA